MTDKPARKPAAQPASKRESRPARAPTARQVRGRAAEDAALAHLLAHGLTLVARNFLCRGGEIDLIMQQRASLVFVEVRQRSDDRHGGALASIGPKKLARLQLAAQVFLQRYAAPPPCRFDVVAIEGDALSWLQNVLQ